MGGGRGGWVGGRREGNMEHVGKEKGEGNMWEGRRGEGNMVHVGREEEGCAGRRNEGM